MKLQKVQKRTAVKHWRNGDKVGLIPCNCYPGGAWVSILWVDKNDYIDHISGMNWQGIYKTDDIVLAAWESMYNSYAYYNLNDNETGTYAHYYIEVEN